MLFDLPRSRFHSEPLATRGERLALGRVLFEADADESGGAAVVEYLEVVEVDAAGQLVASVIFDPADADGAYAELDRRWEAGEGLGPFSFRAYAAAVASRDWDTIAKLYPPGFVEQDHRVVRLLGTSRGAEASQQDRALVELAPDTAVRLDHVRRGGRGSIWQATWYGLRDGGAYEIPLIGVVEIDDQGALRRNDFYDPEQIDQAFARFAELAAPRMATSNAASAAMGRWEAAYDAGYTRGDWDPMRALCGPRMVFDDRRRLALVSGDRELMIASARERAASGARPQQTVIGLAGERVALMQMLWSGGPPDGRFEIEYLGVIEVDGAGLLTAIVIFDVDDRLVAQREAEMRSART
jgi:hypothetical protein